MPKTIVITGASDGIGAAAARRLTAGGHTVVVVGRSPAKTAAIAQETGSDHFTADFADLSDVRALASELVTRYPRIDVLANNAGGVFGDPQKTVDGFEKTLQVNHLAPFLLTNLLMPVLLASDARVIQTSSNAARIAGRIDLDDLQNDARLTPMKAYGDAKLANILFTTELHRRFGVHGLTSAAFHPGTVASGFGSETPSRLTHLMYDNRLVRRLISTPEQGADQLVWLATAPVSEWVSGGYFEKRRVAAKSSPRARDGQFARRHWEASAALVGLQ